MGSRNWAALGGILFPLGVIAAFSTFGDGPPENPAGAKEYYEDLQGVLAYAMGTLGAVGLAMLAAALHRATRSVTATAAFLAGGALVMAAFAMLLGLAETSQELKGFSYDTSLIDVVETSSYFLVTAGHALIGIGAIATGLAARVTGGLPSWLAWVSIVVGVVGLASPAFLPMLALWAWALVVGIVLLVRREPAGVAVTTD